MVNIQYTGRHTTNLIDDVISPAALKRAAEDRTGINNFRPFEELGRNLRQAYANPGNNVLNISVRQVFSSTPVNVIWDQQKANNFTYVPPVSSFASIGYANNSALSKSLSDYFAQFNHGISRVVSKVALLVSVYIISPVTEFGSKSKALIFGRDYKVGQTSRSFTGFTMPTFIRTSLVVAAIGFSSVLLFQGINNPNATPNTTSDSNGTTTIRNDANRKPSTTPATGPMNSLPSTSKSSGTSTVSPNQASTSSQVGESANSTTTPTTGTSAASESAPSLSPNQTTPAPPLPVVTSPVTVPTAPLIINDPILSQPVLP